VIGASSKRLNPRDPRRQSAVISPAEFRVITGTVSGAAGSRSSGVIRADQT
jgi:hypothetical protein